MKEKVTLVIPTIRENCFKDFVERWKNVGLFDHIDRFIVMEDNPTKTFLVDPYPGLRTDHFCWEDISKVLGDGEWIIPRRSDTVRSFAYLEAWKGYFNGPENLWSPDDVVKPDYILTLDDDCYPCTSEKDGLDYNGLGFLRGHIDSMEKTRWFNTLSSVKPRGIPFYNLKSTRDRIIVNHGLWTNVLDYDAPYQLANPIEEEFSFDNRIVPASLYFPMCGMNVMWRRDATVLMYHLLMGKRKFMLETADNFIPPVFPKPGPVLDQDGLIRLPFDRFGDIWCGIFMKKIADVSRLLVTTGMPYIRHERASNPFTNLKKEANGIEVNEDLWSYVDGWDPILSGERDLPSLYSELGGHVGQFVKVYPKYAEYEEYFSLLGKAMVQWTGLFQEGK